MRLELKNQPSIFAVLNKFAFVLWEISVFFARILKFTQ